MAGNEPKADGSDTEAEDTDHTYDELESELSFLQVRVLELEFGVFCRPGQGQPSVGRPQIEYSAEFQMDLRDTDCYLRFDDYERYIRVKIAGHDTRVAQSVTIATESIDRVSMNIRWVLFELTHSVSYETEENFLPEKDTGVVVEDAKYRIRRKALLDQKSDYNEYITGHQRVAPYASKMIRLHILEEDLDKFLKIAREARLPYIGELEPSSAALKLYSQENLHKAKRWIRSISCWGVEYQLEAILSMGLLTPKEMHDQLRKVFHPLIKKNPDEAVHILHHFAQVLKRHIDQRDYSKTCAVIFEDAMDEFRSANAPGTLLKKEGAHDFMCAQVTFTPTTYILTGPFPDMSNRVVRIFEDHQDYFVRVHFVDEDLMAYRYNRDVSNAQYIFPGVRDVLRDGFRISNRPFEFLGYSSSSLRDHAFWFVSPFTIGDMEWNAEAIRASLGDFSIIRDPNGNEISNDKTIKCPARYGARLAQAFSTTEPSIKIKRSELRHLDDIERDGSLFTDGVGTISMELADEVWECLCHRRRRGTSKLDVKPSAYQIRFQGYKGVVVVNPELQGRQLCLRPSMNKFHSESSWDLEICKSFDRPSKAHLNRPLIMLLETNGIERDAFLKLQRAAVQEASIITDTPSDFARLVSFYSLGGSFSLVFLLRQLEKRKIFDFSRFKEHNDGILGFLQRLALLSKGHILRELKHHARIPVPDSWTLVGVADEWDGLDEGEIYVNVNEPNGSGSIWLEGEVLVSRSPTVHRGDAQFHQAMGEPPEGSSYCKLSNLIIFSVKGDRSPASCLGGGDLDGDIFVIITEGPGLHPLAPVDPATYGDVDRKELDRNSTISDVTDFVMEYFNSDYIGLVATNSLIIADQNEEGLGHRHCVKLAELHSQAVDYAKNGIPVQKDQIPRPKGSRKPDWNAGELRDTRSPRYYESQKSIGYLFRDIQVPGAPRPRRGPPIPLFRPKQKKVEEPPPPPPRWFGKDEAERRLAPDGYPALSSSLPAAKQQPRSVWGKPRQGSAPNPKSGPQGRSTGSHSSTPTSTETNIHPPPGLLPPPGLRPLTSLPPCDPSTILRRLQDLALPYLDTDKALVAPDEDIKDLSEVYGRFVIDLQNISVAQSLGEALMEEELVIGTIIARCSQNRRRRELAIRMRSLTSRLVAHVRATISKNGDIPFKTQLRRSLATYQIAAQDADGHAWGSSAMCIVALAAFCDALEKLEGHSGSDFPVEPFEVGSMDTEAP